VSHVGDWLAAGYYIIGRCMHTYDSPLLLRTFIRVDDWK
jgi:hypothetical protein